MSSDRSAEDEFRKNKKEKYSLESKGTSISDRLVKLQQLKRKKQESEKLNKQDLFQDYKQQKLKSIEYKKIEKKKLSTETEQEKLNSLEKGEDFERKQNWDWTIEDCEKWDMKNKRKGKNLKSGFQNFNIMAEQAYNRELLNQKVDKDAYEQQKKELDRKSSGEHQQQMSKILPPSDKPKATDVRLLVRNIEDANSRRMKRRRNKEDEDDVNSYINDKNKQFNLKLNRQYDE